MACNTVLNGITNCDSPSGGVVRILLVAKEHVSDQDIQNGQVVDITVASPVAEYTFRQGQAMASTASNIDFGAGTTVFENTLTVHFKNQEVTKRNELMLLAKAQQELVAFYQLDTGIWFALGIMEDEKTGARVSEITSESGQNRADANEYVLSIAETEAKELPFVVAEAVIDQLVSGS